MSGGSQNPILVLSALSSASIELINPAVLKLSPPPAYKPPPRQGGSHLIQGVLNPLDLPPHLVSSNIANTYACPMLYDPMDTPAPEQGSVDDDACQVARHTLCATCHWDVAQFSESHMGYSLYYYVADFCMDIDATFQFPEQMAGHAAMVSAALLDAGIHCQGEHEVYAIGLETPLWGCLVRGLLAAMIWGALRSPNLHSFLDYL
ncbi:hypothetical protein B0F90DRAFT_1816894 [Multifurca ochricompacta]|uniref:Uncharacterized protein n=1 Tax=Multifurca ochricompacta TaxID=376703 RepID=A0AAD4M6V1_9AGAM|nr:hypothetical protein B0F90DRAFT_1816894 [Multifurca ochricompacta]